jgi:hypothetical protein
MRFSLRLTWPVDSSLVVPLELAQIWAPLAVSFEVQPPAWPFWESFYLSWLDQKSPPWLAVKSLLSVFVGWLTYIIYSAFTVYFAFLLALVFFSLFDQIFSPNVCFQLTFNSATLFTHCSVTIWLLFDYCSVFWSWKCIPDILIS